MWLLSLADATSPALVGLLTPEPELPGLLVASAQNCATMA